MNKVVLDASAVLALLNQEPGYEIVEKHLSNGIISAVNFSEVVSVLVDIGMSISEAETVIVELIKEIIPFDQQQAHIAGGMRKTTKSYGLSLGDRACLALAKIRNLPALTADKIWSKLNHPTKIILIR